jgi:hypothetical protein
MAFDSCRNQVYSTVPASYNRSLGELSQQALNTFRPARPQKPLEPIRARIL